MKSSRSTVWKVVRVASVIGLAAAVVSMWPDFKRYMKIERM